MRPSFTTLTIFLLFLTSFTIISQAYDKPFENKKSYLLYQDEPSAIHHIDELTFAGSILTVIQGASGAKNINGWDDKVAINYLTNIELKSDIRDGDTLFFRFEAAEGRGLSGDSIFPFSSANALSISPSSNSNATNARFRIAEAYWEVEPAHGKLLFTLGKLDLSQYFDQNAYANNEYDQFINAMFRNATTIEMPNYSFGTRLSWHPTDYFEMTGGIAESTSTINQWNDQGDGSFNFIQLNFKPKWSWSWNNRDGHYRLWSWLDTSRHIRILDATANDANKGYGFSFDQQFGDNWGGFLRGGWQDEDINHIRSNWSLGMHFTGRTWESRPITGAFGVGQNILSRDAKKIAPYLGESISPETHFEAWVNVPVTDRMAFRPDIQVISQPRALKDNRTVTLVGMIGKITF